MVERIKDLCKRTGDSIASLERKTGIGNGVIRRWDKAKPSMDLVKRIAEYFNVSTDYLIYGSDDSASNLPSNSDEFGFQFEVLTRDGEKLSKDKKDKLFEALGYVVNLSDCIIKPL